MYLGVLHIPRKLFPYLLVLGVLLALIFLPHVPVHAATGVNQQLNFQGRLLNTAGATVPDGYYNVQFKIYQDGDGLTAGDTTGSPAGSLKWTESYLNNTSQGVTVVNGFMSVQLGSITPFGTNIDWNQNTIWLSVNIGSTNTSCTPFASCTPDGEMVPMKRMSASPYALNSGLLGGLTSAQFLQIAQGVQTDASVGVNSIAINKTSTGNFIDFQSSGVDAFTLTNSGDITLGANANHTLSVATAAASTAGKNLALNAGTGGSGTGSAGGTLSLQGGAAGGTNAVGGNITIDAGAGTGVGTAGAINIGSGAASSIQIGSTALASGTQTIGIGNNGTSGGTTNVVIGASGSASGTTTIQAGAGNALNVGTANTTTLNIGDASFSSGTQTISIGTNVTAGGTTTLKIGSSTVGSVTTVQGGGGIALNGAVNANSTINAVTGYSYNGTAGATTTCASGQYLQQQVVKGGITTGGTCSTLASTTTLQDAYNNSGATTPQIALSGTGNGLLVRDNSTPIGGNLFAVQNNAGSASYLAVTASGASVAGTFTATGTINNATISGGTLSGGSVSGGTLSATALTFGTAATTVGLTQAAAATAGGNLTVQGGQSGTGAVNGGDVTVQGGTSAGTGVQGLVKLSTSAFTTAAAQNFTANANVTQANIDNYASVEITASGAGPWTATIPAPTTKYNGRLLYIQISTITGATSITLAPSGGTTISMTANTAVTLVWNTTANGWLNAGADSGSNSYIQNQTAATQTAGFKINGTGTAASFIGSGLDVAAASTLSLGTATSNGVTIGNATVASTIAIGGTGANTISLGNTQTGGTIAVGTALTSGTVGIGGTAAGTNVVTIQGGTTSTGAVLLQSGVNGLIGVGTNNIANTIQIGSSSLSSGIQAINVGTGNTSGGTTNVTVGTTASAGGGTTVIQSKNNTTISTNGVARATFDTSGNLYVGNGVSNISPANFTIQGTASTASGVAGGNVTVQGGNATTGTTNGGNLTLAGGTASGSGANGLVILTTTSAQTVNDSNCYNASTSCTISLTSLNNNSAIIAGFPTTPGQTVTLPDPPITTAGRQVYITASNGSQDFTLIANSGAGAGIEQDIAMRQNTSATMVWNGSDWTAAGASSSTTLQSAYNNTLQSAGGAELVVSKTSSTNGLTIRDSTAASVNGTLLQVQSKTAANLFSVSSNVSDYASDNGAETAGGSSTTFPANTWSTSGTGVTLTRYTTTGNYIATGQASTSVQTSATANTGVKNQIVDPTSGSNASLTANTQYNVSFSTRLLSGTFTTLTVYYSVNGTTQSVPCINSQTAQTSITSNWSKINCSFTAPTSGETTSNAILIQQSDATARTFYVDNLSVTIAAGQNYATDGGVDDAVNFSTNWTSAGAGTVAVTQNTLDGNDTSDSAQAAISSNTAGAGIRNKLSIYPLTNTLYRMSVYAKLNSGAAFNDFKVRYSPDGGTNYVDCADYNTQTVTTTGWTAITCYVNTIGTTVSNPYAYFVQTNAPGGSRNFSVDTFSMTLANSTTPDVQIGSGTAGGPVTLFTLDSAASAPIAANNSSLYGSMYYDTTQGKIQCYQAAGWGACGASPNSIVTISPEYTNAVMHGTGVGTMVSDFCSGASGVNINDGTSGQPGICGSSETYNFYRWTSPQPTPQAYSIYVTYQLPSTFKQFTSGQTSLQARVDNTSNAFVKMQIYKNHSGLTTCGGNVTITTSASTWQYPAASGTADPSTCGFTGSDSIVFKITTSANSNANAYVGNLNFTFSNS